MKLKVLPPTLRKNNRYLALDIKVKSVISKDDHYQAILRCQREYVDEVRASLALIYKHNRKDISVSTIGLSGTIKACQKFIEK